MQADLPFQAHSETSREAAASMAKVAPGDEQRVYEYLRCQGWEGATDEQIQLATGLNPNTERPRRVNLCRKGLVREGTQKRLTRSGRRASVWVAVPR